MPRLRAAADCPARASGEVESRYGPLGAVLEWLLEAGRTDDARMLLWELWDWVKGQTNAPMVHLQTAVARSAHLYPGRRAALITQLGIWMRDDAGQRAALAAVVALLPDLVADERTSLAEALIASEQLESTVPTRVLLLQTTLPVYGAGVAAPNSSSA